MISRQAAKASARCGAATPTQTATSPTARCPRRCTQRPALAPWRASGRFHDARALGGRERLEGLVVERRHAAALVEIAHPALERGESAGCRTRERGGELGRVDRRRRELEGFHPPATGGMKTISSPSSSRRSQSLNAVVHRDLAAATPAGGNRDAPRAPRRARPASPQPYRRFRPAVLPARAAARSTAGSRAASGGPAGTERGAHRGGVLGRIGVVERRGTRLARAAGRRAPPGTCAGNPGRLRPERGSPRGFAARRWRTGVPAARRGGSGTRLRAGVGSRRATSAASVASSSRGRSQASTSQAASGCCACAAMMPAIGPRPAVPSTICG